MRKGEISLKKRMGRKTPFLLEGKRIAEKKRPPPISKDILQGRTLLFLKEKEEERFPLPSKSTQEK